MAEANVPAQEQISKFRITLQEYPRRWYAKNLEKFQTLELLETLFKKKFEAVVSRAEHLKHFQDLALKPSEPLQDYKMRVVKTASKAGINDEEVMAAQFVTGLPASIRAIVRAQKDKTLDDVTLTAQAACVDCPQASATGTAFAVKSEQSDFDLPAAMGSLYVSRQEPSPYGNRRRSTSRSRSRQNDWQPDYRRDAYSRDSRYDNRGRRDNRGRYRDPSNDRSSSRSVSRDRNSFRRPRDQTPRGQDRKVKFDRPRSQSPPTCKFCKKKGHVLGQCRSLLKLIESGQVTCPEDF